MSVSEESLDALQKRADRWLRRAIDAETKVERVEALVDGWRATAFHAVDVQTRKMCQEITDALALTPADPEPQTPPPPIVCTEDHRCYQNDDDWGVSRWCEEHRAEFYAWQKRTYPDRGTNT